MAILGGPDVSRLVPADDQLQQLGAEFVARTEAKGDGLSLPEFCQMMLPYLRTRGQTREHTLALVEQLAELFDRIDFNGDNSLEWEEFTSYCVEAGLVASRVIKRPLKYKYAVDEDFTDRSGAAGVLFLRYSPLHDDEELAPGEDEGRRLRAGPHGRVYCCTRGSRELLVLDSNGRLLKKVWVKVPLPTHVIAPQHAEPERRIITSAATRVAAVREDASKAARASVAWLSAARRVGSGRRRSAPAAAPGLLSGADRDALAKGKLQAERVAKVANLQPHLSSSAMEREGPLAPDADFVLLPYELRTGRHRVSHTTSDIVTVRLKSTRIALKQARAAKAVKRRGGDDAAVAKAAADVRSAANAARSRRTGGSGGDHRGQEEEEDAGSLICAEFVPDVRWVACSASDNTITFWNGDTWEYAGVLHQTEPQVCMRWCPGLGLLLTAGGKNGEVHAWDVRAKVRVATLRADPKGDVGTAAALQHTDFVADIVEVGYPHDLVVTAGMDRRILLWNGERPIDDNGSWYFRCVGQLKGGHSTGLRQLCYSESNDILLSVAFGLDAVAWDVGSRLMLFTLSGHRHTLVGLALTAATPQQAVTADIEGNFKVWDITRRSAKTAAPLVMSFDGNTELATFAPNCFVSCGAAHTLIGGGRSLKLFRSVRISDMDEKPVTGLYSDALGCFISGAGTSITLWNATTGEPIHKFYNVVEHPISALALGSRGRQVLAATSKGAVIVLNGLDGHRLKEGAAHSQDIVGMAYNSEDCCIISASWDRTIHIHDDLADAETAPLLRSVTNAHEADITSLAFDRLLNLVVTGAADGTVRMWDFQTLKLVGVCEGHTEEITEVVLAPPMPVLLSSDGTGTLFVWATKPSLWSSRCLLGIVNKGVVEDPAASREARRQARSRTRSPGKRSRSGTGDSAGGSSTVSLGLNTPRSSPDGTENEGEESEDSEGEVSVAPRASGAERAAEATSKRVHAETFRPDKWEGPCVITAVQAVCSELSRSQYSTMLVFTGDEQGYIKLWDLSRELCQLPLRKVTIDKSPAGLGSYNPRQRIKRRFAGPAVQPATPAPATSDIDRHAKAVGHATTAVIGLQRDASATASRRDLRRKASEALLRKQTMEKKKSARLGSMRSMSSMRTMRSMRAKSMRMQSHKSMRHNAAASSLDVVAESRSDSSLAEIVDVLPGGEEKPDESSRDPFEALEEALEHAIQVSTDEDSSDEAPSDAGSPVSPLRVTFGESASPKHGLRRADTAAMNKAEAALQSAKSEAKKTADALTEDLKRLQSFRGKADVRRFLRQARKRLNKAQSSMNITATVGAMRGSVAAVRARRRATAKLETRSRMTATQWAKSRIHHELEPVTLWRAHGDGIRSLVFNQEAGLLCSTSHDLSVRLWSAGGAALGVLDMSIADAKAGLRELTPWRFAVDTEKIARAAREKAEAVLAEIDSTKRRHARRRQQVHMGSTARSELDEARRKSVALFMKSMSQKALLAVRGQFDTDPTEASRNTDSERRAKLEAERRRYAKVSEKGRPRVDGERSRKFEEMLVHVNPRAAAAAQERRKHEQDSSSSASSASSASDDAGEERSGRGRRRAPRVGGSASAPTLGGAAGQLSLSTAIDQLTVHRTDVPNVFRPERSESATLLHGSGASKGESSAAATGGDGASAVPPSGRNSAPLQTQRASTPGVTAASPLASGSTSPSRRGALFTQALQGGKAKGTVAAWIGIGGGPSAEKTEQQKAQLLAKAKQRAEHAAALAASRKRHGGLRYSHMAVEERRAMSRTKPIGEEPDPAEPSDFLVEKLGLVEGKVVKKRTEYKRIPAQGPRAGSPPVAGSLLPRRQRPASARASLRTGHDGIVPVGGMSAHVVRPVPRRSRLRPASAPLARPAREDRAAAEEAHRRMMARHESEAALRRVSSTVSRFKEALRDTAEDEDALREAMSMSRSLRKSSSSRVSLVQRERDRIAEQRRKRAAEARERGDEVVDVVAVHRGKPTKPFGDYSKSDVVAFKRMYQAIDKDGSGSIDIAEFTSSPSFSTSEMFFLANSTFRSLDADASGEVTLDELLPVQFPLATKRQISNMAAYILKCIREENEVRVEQRRRLRRMMSKQASASIEGTASSDDGSRGAQAMMW